jgi:phenylalanyl-tRNA synthetase beta chain
MIISLRWLNDFVDVTEFLQKPEALAETLTRAGLEVENINNRAKDFQFVVTALILEKNKHPDADKLSLCRVTTGEGVIHQIVCGAQNHKANDRVVLALPGAVLPGNFAIQRAMVRGIESGGMLCSDKELGLSKESQGIRILPEDAPIGKSFAEYAGLDDVTFELKVTPNRADCLSHYGLAREVACLLGRPLKPLKTEPKLSGNSTRSEISLDVRVPDLCPRYAGRYITQVKVGESPDWLKKRLESVGLNSINNIVDVTNYVMMELGQPLHAFDAQEIKGRKIIVDRAQAKEKFQSLDGTELTLTGDELVIRDQERPIAIAGVVGGKNSGVKDSTTDIFLESAYFSPMVVRKASRTHGITTDSGYRFSRGVDPNNTVEAMDHAVQLIQKVAGGVAYGEHYDNYPNPLKKKPVKIALQTVTDRLGYPAEKQKFVDFMQRLGCVVETLGESEFQVLPPTFRFDIEHEMDLVEEYARLNGYEHIPEVIPSTSVEPAHHDRHFLFNQKLTQILLGQGLKQALNLAFTAKKAERDFLQNFSAIQATGLPVSEKPIQLLNPLSDDLNVMRSTLTFGLFRNVMYNFHQGNESGALFEIGKTFHFNEKSEYVESSRLALAQWGYHTQLWQQNPQYPLVFELKAKVEALLAHLNIHSYQWIVPSAEAAESSVVPTFLHRGQWAILQVEGKKAGFIGALHPALADANKIRVPTVLCEMNLDLLLADQPRAERFVPVSKFPVVQRDMALQMKKSIQAGDVAREIKKLAGPLLISVDVFDFYEGDKMEVGQKSVAFRLRLQDKNVTLQDEAVNKLIETVMTGLKTKFSLTLR